ncbi:MAG: ribonuclease H family protein [Gemmatimonadota bacterium]
MARPSSRSDLVYVHADESCLGNQFQDRATPGGAAALVETFRERGGWVRRDCFVSEPDTTNNRMALRSAIEVLRLLKPASIVFTSDSNYLVTGMREWVYAWAARHWRRKGGAIENLDLWAELVRRARGHRIEWRWVRGHAGHAKNEYANRLAILAAEKQLDSGGFVPSEFDAWLEGQMEHGRYLDFYDVPPAAPFRPERPPPAPPS